VSDVETPVGPTSTPDDPAAGRRCPRCSSAVQPSQEYCLECGLRLPRTDPRRLDVAAGGLVERHPWGRGWLVPALLGLVVAAGGTAAAIAISDANGGGTTITAATGGSRTVTESTATLTAPEPTAPATTAASPPATTNRPPATAPPRPATLAWPQGRRGWTIVLLSVPKPNGRAGAEARAADARRKGVPNVGILDSSRFASLHPGYFVVFSGVFDSEAEATSALPRTRSAFPLAYGRQVVP
jgi:hypothetical protein